MKSMALKVDVSKEDQEAINDLMQQAKFPSQRRKFHCTIGFIASSIPEDEVHEFGTRITEDLQAYVDEHKPLYQIDRAIHIFGHFIAFEPTHESKEKLKQANKWLFERVKIVAEDRWGLNEETIPEKYFPHMTVWRTRRADKRIHKLNELVQSHPAYYLKKAAYVLF